MTSTTIQLRRKAIAVRRAGELARALDPLNETLRSATDEPIPNEALILAEVAASLANICRQQREHITKLAERIEALEVGEAPAK